MAGNNGALTRMALSTKAKRLFLRFSGKGANDAPWSSADWLWAGFAAFVVICANALVIWPLDLLWFDDVTSYAATVDGFTTPRAGFTARHSVLDTIQNQLLVGISPFAARLFILCLGVIPATLFGYILGRRAFSLYPSMAALFATTPFIVAVQYEIIVGINISYIIFDLAVFYGCVLIAYHLRETRTFSSTFVGSIILVSIILEGMVSVVLLGPALFIISATFVRGPWSNRIVLLGSIFIASLVSLWRQATSERSQSAPFADFPDLFVRNLGRVADQLFVGEEFVAWIILAMLLFVIGGYGLLCLIWRCWHEAAVPLLFGLFVLGAAAMYAANFPWHPNRYGFLPIAGYALGIAWILDKAVYCIHKSDGGDVRRWRRASKDMISIFAAVVIGWLAYDKAQGLHPIKSMNDFAYSVRLYLVGGAYGGGVRRGEAFVESRRADQLIIVTDGHTPIFYQNVYPALGFVRYVSGRRDLMGWVGRASNCENPFAFWTSDWQMGPAGFTEAAPIRVIGFRGRFGSGVELQYLLSAPAGELNSSEGGPRPWRLFMLENDGIQLVGEGEGGLALQETLENLGVPAYQVALNCGIGL